jgi:hypothetical protein
MKKSAVIGKTACVAVYLKHPHLKLYCNHLSGQLEASKKLCTVGEDWNDDEKSPLCECQQVVNQPNCITL